MAWHLERKTGTGEGKAQKLAGGQASESGGWLKCGAGIRPEDRVPGGVNARTVAVPA